MKGNKKCKRIHDDKDIMPRPVPPVLHQHREDGPSRPPPEILFPTTRSHLCSMASAADSCARRGPSCCFLHGVCAALAHRPWRGPNSRGSAQQAPICRPAASGPVSSMRTAFIQICMEVRGSAFFHLISPQMKNASAF
jgi:hypothetical protein